MMNYLKLIRPINILFLIYIMLVFRFAFVMPSIYKVYNYIPNLSLVEFIFLLLTVVLIAASGYIINDIYDSDIDTVNKPDKVIVEKLISVDDAYNFYKIVCVLAIVCLVVLTILTKNYRVAILPILIMVGLNFYAQIFKKILLLGNSIIAFFAAIVLVLPVLYENNIETELLFPVAGQIQNGIIVAGFSYGIFAFITTLIREIIKDIEDRKGDKQYNCNTLPIAIGINKTKIVIVFLFLLLGAYLFSFANFFNSINIKNISILITLLLIVPLLLFSVLLFFAKQNKHYTILSNSFKIYMFIGVSSMFYFIYANGTGSYLFMQYVNYVKKLF